MDDSLTSLMAWLDASPTPYHVVETAVEKLEAAEYTGISLLASELPTNGFIRLDGALIAWRLGDSGGALRIIGAHTDSPNLRVRPNPDVTVAGWSQLGVEIYGGVLLNSWLDRELGIAGRVIAPDGTPHLFNSKKPLARVPQLAIHLDREISERGLVLDRQAHINPVWGLGTKSFNEWLTDVCGFTPTAFDAQLYDIQSASILGEADEFLASGRLDNQLSCWAAIESLIAAEDSLHSHIVVLNDHEEVGSESSRGAGGPILSSVINRIAEQHSLTVGQQFDRAEKSWCLSADNAHAIHPNYLERHEPQHAPRPNLGPALKLNGNQRYATTVRGAAHLHNVAEKADTPLQTFVSRNNMPCGSTIGPITATKLGIEAIDIGIPQLSMHSAREMCGSEDPQHMVNLMKSFLQN